MYKQKEESLNERLNNIATNDFFALKISEAKADILKWSLIFMTGQTVVLVGIIFWMLYK